MRKENCLIALSFPFWKRKSFFNLEEREKMKRKITLLVTALIFTFVLGACAGEKSEGKQSDTAEETSAKDLVIAKASDAVTLDPAASNDTVSSDVQVNIFEKLVLLDGESKLQAHLATDWEQVEDKIWEFKLVEGVKFHDGSDFNAEVVKANIERTIDPDIGSPRAMLYNMIEEVEVVDESTVRFHTAYPFAPLPAHLSHPGGVMISKEQIEADYAAIKEGKEPGAVINEHPIGTGPFEFSEWKNGEFIQLTKNPDYWGEEVNLSSVTFKVVAEDLTRLAELETGDTHISNPLSPSDVEQVEGNPDLKVQKQASSSLTYLGFNTEKPPFNNAKVRQAISLAIDKEEILSGVYDNIGLIAEGPLAPPVFGYDESVKVESYNLEKAKDLLKEAGYEDGFEASIWTNDSRDRIDLATNLQAQLSEIGIKLNVEVTEWGSMLELTANGEHELAVFGWTTVTGDADNGLYPLFHSDNLGAAGNQTFTNDEKIDEALQNARQATNDKERLAYYKEAQEGIIELAPIVPIHHQEYLLGVDANVEGLVQSPIQILELNQTSIK